MTQNTKIILGSIAGIIAVNVIGKLINPQFDPGVLGVALIVIIVVALVGGVRHWFKGPTVISLKDEPKDE